MNSANPRRRGNPLLFNLKRYLPGILLLLLGAELAWVIGPTVPVLNRLLVGILIGIVLSNLVGIPEWASDGLKSHKVWLGSAIVLMGASLTVSTVVESGLRVLLLVFLTTSFTVMFVEIFTRYVYSVDQKLGSLLAAGSSICGVSAVVAIAGSIRAREEHIAYAAGTILLFDAITLVFYPAVGNLLSLPDRLFGIWAGLSMFSTGPVVAVGFTYSETAGQWATLTKLTRNTLIGVLAVAYALYYTHHRLSESEQVDGVNIRELWTRFPKFIVGFLCFMLLSSAGLFSAEQLQTVEHAYNWLFLVAFVGLGTELRLTELRRAGVKPVLIVLATWITLSFLSLVVISTVLS